jgi:hypothetical protein
MYMFTSGVHPHFMNRFFCNNNNVTPRSSQCRFLNRWASQIAQRMAAISKLSFVGFMYSYKLP